MILSVHQPQYLPWLGYFDKIAQSDCFVFLDNVQYKHREFQNRNKIRTKEGWMWLSVSVKIKGAEKKIISDVNIDNDLDWGRGHKESIKHCYGKARFFKEYYSFFEDIYSVKWEKLIELNVHIIQYLLKELKISTPIFYESKLGVSSKSTYRIIDICKNLKADTYLSGIGGKDYLEEEKFDKDGIKLVYQDFVHPVYNQQFMQDKNSFIPYMSVIDLLFNEGENSMKILRGGI